MAKEVGRSDRSFGGAVRGAVPSGGVRKRGRRDQSQSCELLSSRRRSHARTHATPRHHPPFPTHQLLSLTLLSPPATATRHGTARAHASASASAGRRLTRQAAAVRASRGDGLWVCAYKCGAFSIRRARAVKWAALRSSRTANRSMVR